VTAAAATLPTYLLTDDTAGDSEAHGEYQEEFEKLNLERQKSEIRKFLSSGSVSKNIHDRLELFSAQQITSEHVWKPCCKQCSTCKLCMESGGQTYMERWQADGFRDHLGKIPHEDGRYHYDLEYLVDPQAALLEDNDLASYQRHQSLRKAFSVLELETQAEFTDRLTRGLGKYWRILPPQEAIDLRNKDGLYLPAGFVLKNQGSTKARLILDPSGNLNAALLKALNLEEKIGSVLRRIQAMPILLSADVREAFFKIKVAPASHHLSLFLMDYDRWTKQLTAKVTENLEMVTIQALVLIMGVN
jgi:hypothetical protein